MKKFVSGLIVGAIVTTTISTFAGGVWDKIDVLKNDINVMVDGKQIFADNFVYNDTTYLPLRTIVEELGQKVTYDEATNTAHIGSVPENNVVVGNVGSVSNPLWIEKDGKRYTNDEFQFEIYEIPNDIKPCDALDIWEISDKANKIVRRDSNQEVIKYSVSSTDIFDWDLGQYLIQYNGGVNDSRYISLECYYTNVQPWLKSLK